MLAKFERYFVPNTRLANIPIPTNLKSDLVYNCYNDKSNGIAQRLNVQPNDILISKNKDRIGFSTKSGRDYNMMGGLVLHLLVIRTWEKGQSLSSRN